MVKRNQKQEATVVKSSKRLQKTEQVLDRKISTGFGAAKPTYVPLKNLSVSQLQSPC